jgi:hypothetical protein
VIGSFTDNIFMGVTGMNNELLYHVFAIITRLFCINVSTLIHSSNLTI